MFTVTLGLEGVGEEQNAQPSGYAYSVMPPRLPFVPRRAQSC